MGDACPRDPARAALDSGRCGCHLSARACGQCSRRAASGRVACWPVRAAHGLRTSQRQAAAPCTRVPYVAKAVAAPCARVRPCPSVDPEGSPELKQQSLSDGRSSESPDALALASSSAAAPSGGSQLAGCGGQTWAGTTDLLLRAMRRSSTTNHSWQAPRLLRVSYPLKSRGF